MRKVTLQKAIGQGARLLRSRSGQSVLELAMVIPLAFLLVVNVVNFGAAGLCLHHRLQCRADRRRVYVDGAGERECSATAIAIHRHQYGAFGHGLVAQCHAGRYYRVQ